MIENLQKKSWLFLDPDLNPRFFACHTNAIPPNMILRRMCVFYIKIILLLTYSHINILLQSTHYGHNNSVFITIIILIVIIIMLVNYVLVFSCEHANMHLEVCNV